MKSDTKLFECSYCNVQSYDYFKFEKDLITGELLCGDCYNQDLF